MSRTSKILHPEAFEPISESDFLTVDADEYWNRISKLSLDEFKNEANTLFFWKVMLRHWTPNGCKRRDFYQNFMKFFWEVGKKNARENATVGTKVKNMQLASWIVTSTRHFHRPLSDALPDMAGNYPEPPGPVTDENGRVVDKNDLAHLVLGLIEDNDTVTLGRILTLLKASESLTPQGEAPDESKKYWDAFVNFIKDHDRLPYREQMAKISGLCPNRCSTIRNRLGLGGLAKRAES